MNKSQPPFLTRSSCDSFSLVVATAERYRAEHLKNNSRYPQFIVGKDIAMLKVDVVSARICNINDEVIKWNVESS